MQGYLVEARGDDRPVCVIVEPSQAACFFASICENNGSPKTVAGDMVTIMAGLACGTPSILAWDILRDYGDVFIACSDSVTVSGMRALGKPQAGDEAIVSGESGAVTLGGLVTIVEQKVPPGLKGVL